MLIEAADDLCTGRSHSLWELHGIEQPRAPSSLVEEECVFFQGGDLLKGFVSLQGSLLCLYPVEVWDIETD